MSEVTHLFRQGNFYARERYWSEAPKPFIEALEKLYDLAENHEPWKNGPSVGLSNDDLQRLERAVEHGRLAVRTSTKIEGGSVYARLRKLLDVGEFQYIDAFRVSPELYPAAGSQPWVVAFLSDVEQIEYGSVRVQIPAKDCRAVAFLLRLGQDELSTKRITAKCMVRMSYAWAHLAQAFMHNIRGQFRESQILMRSAGYPLVSFSKYYHNALLLHPGSGWTLAHYGEIFRDLANSWPGDTTDLAPAESRIDDYVRALVFYRASLDREPKSAWANAHLGAAIVNARAFVGCVGPEARPRIPRSLNDLLEAWFPDARGPEGLLLHFIDCSTRKFAKALALRPVYTWCSVYYSGALLLKAMFSADTWDHERGRSGESYDLAVIGRVMLEQATYMDPDVLKKMFDPGRLWVNAIYESGLVYFYLGEYDLAWQHIVVGTNFLARNGFLIGLQALSGCHMLANIGLYGIAYDRRRRKFIHKCCKECESRGGAAEKCKKKCKKKWDRLHGAVGNDDRLIQQIGYSRENAPASWIPFRRVRTCEELAEFIDHAFEVYCAPYIDVPLESAHAVFVSSSTPTVALDIDKPMMDLLEIQKIVSDLMGLLHHCSQPPTYFSGGERGGGGQGEPHESPGDCECDRCAKRCAVKKKLRGLLHRIEEKTGATFSGGAGGGSAKEPVDAKVVDAKVVAADLLFSMTTGTFGYYTSRRLKRKHAGG